MTQRPTRRDVFRSAAAPHGYGARQELEQIANRAPTARHGHFLQHFGDEHEKRDDE